MGSLAILVLLLLADAIRRTGVLPGSSVPHPVPAPTPLPQVPARQAETAQASADRAQAEADAAARRAAQAAAAARTPPPWPQVTPAGLPPFPGGWEPDQPPPSAVVARAWQLLPQLWASGRPGAIRTEQTQGRWITYQAALHAGGKRGVTAWRVRAGAASSPSARPAAASTGPGGLAILRYGSSGPAVTKLQQHLGITADGKFGPKTHAAVLAFQRARGLKPDGIVGPATWAELTRARAA